jgi:TolB-like protein/Tfp pilus assembly protein PilF
MACLIPGYEYDIFISYRQKDNKHDGWVTEFVDNLKGELESTFKEEISVYFDINPHDGLLETHDVGASLKDKLKCLIFIPIFSRTYCDPKSFAWEHEFKAFIELASQDQFGLKVKLLSGNVASRVLPVQIHDLDEDDKKLIESELGGYIRGIEFIYKEPGVNKPLSIRDDEKKNLNKTKYEIQVNKVANAIKEIIIGLNNPLSDRNVGSKDISEEKPINRKMRRTRIIAGTLLLLALIIAGYFILQRHKNPTEQLEKSIAVLPFRNDSPNDSTTYFLNGVMEEILNNLQKISDFSRVLSRTSTEQYRGDTKTTIPEIAKKLGVNYVVEGSGQKYGNSYRLRIQLITGKNERHLWGESYEKEIGETKDIYNTQSEIAQSIASELKATITTEEKQLINKIPTSNLTAYDFYQRGSEAWWKYVSNGKREELENSEDLFHKALGYDPKFAQAYSGLSYIYWAKHYWETFSSNNFLDSVLILTNIALSYDDQLSEAHSIKGYYYSEIGKKEKALKELDTALKLNPNDWMAYFFRASVFSEYDYVKSIKDLLKAISLNHGSQLPMILRYLDFTYLQTGFIEKCKYYAQEALELDKDSSSYYGDLASIEYISGNFIKNLEFHKKAYAKDTSNSYVSFFLGIDYMFLRQSDKALHYYKEYLQKRDKTLSDVDYFGLHRIGWAYLQIGDKKEAEYYFNELINYCDRLKIMERADPFRPAYDLAATYSIMGDKKNAYVNLRLFAKNPICTAWNMALLKYDPLFDSIRNEPEFLKIMTNMEAKYKAEHERVRKWLEEKGML